MRYFTRKLELVSDILRAIFASLKDQINKIKWDCLNTNESSTNDLCIKHSKHQWIQFKRSLHETLLNISSEICEENFPFTEIKMKPKNLKTPWLGKGLKIFSKTRQRLYIEFLKSKKYWRWKKTLRTTKIFSKNA